jgi:hypothetical protein
MGPGVLALVAIVSMAAAPKAPLTACRLFAPTASCGPGARLVLLPFDPKTQTAAQFMIVESTPEPTDCGMVKHVDPSFKSKMPVSTPDPKLALPIKIVPVPSCDPERR